MSEVRITWFQRQLEKALFPDNTFLKYSKDGGQPNVATVEIPQATATNRPVLGGVNSGYYTTANNLANATGLTPIIRVNDKLTYNNTIIRLPNPIVIETLQEAELSYNKAAQIASEEADNLNTAIANYALAQWAQDNASYIIPSTGKTSAGVVESRISIVTGGYAGAVKRFSYEDLLALQTAVRKQNINGGQWVALPTVEQWEDIRRIANVVDFEKTGNETMLKSGVIGKWDRILFLDPRQNDATQANVVYDITSTAAPVPIAYDGTINSNCVSALLCWNADYVEKNEGSLVFFSRTKDPVYMGDLMNWGVRFGASKRRLDGKGVIAVYETPVS
jgi:hypothetical protein